MLPRTVLPGDVFLDVQKKTSKKKRPSPGEASCIYPNRPPGGAEVMLNELPVAYPNRPPGGATFRSPSNIVGMFSLDRSVSVTPSRIMSCLFRSFDVAWWILMTRSPDPLTVSASNHNTLPFARWDKVLCAWTESHCLVGVFDVLNTSRCKLSTEVFRSDPHLDDC